MSCVLFCTSNAQDTNVTFRPILKSNSHQFLCLANKMNTVRLELPPNEAGDVLTVKHLAQEVCIETGVDLWNQILTFKGHLEWFN